MACCWWYFFGGQFGKIYHSYKYNNVTSGDWFYRYKGTVRYTVVLHAMTKDFRKLNHQLGTSSINRILCSYKKGSFLMYWYRKISKIMKEKCRRRCMESYHLYKGSKGQEMTTHIFFLGRKVYLQDCPATDQRNRRSRWPLWWLPCNQDWEPQTRSSPKEIPKDTVGGKKVKEEKGSKTLIIISVSLILATTNTTQMIKDSVDEG